MPVLLWHGRALAAVLVAAAVDTPAAQQPPYGIVHASPRDAARGNHLADELTKLAALHRSGDLEDDEFRAAKRQLLAPTAAALPFGQQVVSIRDHGAVGDSVHDDTDSIQAAIDTATNRSASVFIPSGTYVITRPLNVTAPVYGETASTSVIANHGDGTDAFLVMTGYHTEFRDFKVIGDCDPTGPCRTRDGIVLSINRSYMRFTNVHTQFHGRHGLIQRASWATSWTNCKFWYNRGLGIFLDAIQGDPGVSNGVSFFGCESRWNGGPVITGGCVECENATHQHDRGGVKIIGAAMVQFVGGVYESNQPCAHYPKSFDASPYELSSWGCAVRPGGFVIDSPYFATREVTISVSHRHPVVGQGQ